MSAETTLLDGRIADLVVNAITAQQISTDQAVAFANSALINTQVAIDFTRPAMTKDRYKLVCYNPSTTSDLTIKIFDKVLSIGGGTHYALIDTVTIPMSQSITGTTEEAHTKFYEGLFVGNDLRLVVSNNTALGAAAGFTAYIRLREV